MDLVIKRKIKVLTHQNQIKVNNSTFQMGVGSALNVRIITFMGELNAIDVRN